MKKIARLSIRDIPIIVGIVYRTGKVVFLQDKLPIPRLVDIFDSKGRSVPDGMDRLAHIRWLTDGILHRLFGGSYCMKRTLILFHYAQRYGVESTVVFGVARDGDTLKGHAWLSIDGEPYKENEGAVDNYKVIYSHPPSNNISSIRVEPGKG
ncbi:MAG: lasso peptide biosynthesis B2 protein [Rhodothermales bacterium]|nr:lasso peptide biosynthesis B2 protein [Rhodothermales bacterium]